MQLPAQPQSGSPQRAAALERIARQGQPSRKWAAKAEAKLKDVDRKILELEEVRGLLAEALRRCGDRCFDSGCEVLDGALARKGASGSGVVPDRRDSPKGDCCSE